MAVSVEPTIELRNEQAAVTHVESSTVGDALLSLWSRNLPGVAPCRFDWLYATGQSEAWLLKDSGRGVIGSTGLLRRRLMLSGEIVESAAVIDWNVDHLRRSIGKEFSLAREPARFADENQWPMTYAVCDRTLASVLNLAKYHPVAEWSLWSKRLCCESLLAARLRSPLMAKLLRPFVNTAMKVASSDWLFSLPANVVAESVTEFDERFDRLWQVAASRFEVLGERTAVALNWRFGRCPTQAYSIFTLVEKSSRELIGYVVWHQHDGVISIADLLAVNDAQTVLLLAEFSRQMRFSGAISLEMSGAIPADFAPTLDAAGFRSRPTGRSVLARSRKPNPEETESAALPQQWFMTAADMDVD